jgi:hypothetical protein
MGKTAKQFESFAELNRLANRETIGSSASAGGGLRQSLPVPTRRQGQLLIAYMYFPSAFKPGLVLLKPPRKVTWLDPSSGKLIALSTVSPADFGLAHPTNEPLPEWNFSLPPGMTTKSYAELRNHFFALYNVLFEVWATDPFARGSSALHDAAREFLKIFDQVSEPPLLPYYDALGRDFFEWVRELAK